MSAQPVSIQAYQLEPATVTIYALADPDTDEIRYIGKADDPHRRLRQHLSAFQLSYYRSQKVSWIKSVLDAGGTPTLHILEIVGPEDANQAEIRWISKALDMGARLTNGTAGGDGGAITDPDALARIGAAHRGVKRSQETRKKMSIAARRRCDDEDERKRLRSISNGKPPVHHGEKNPRTKLSDLQVRSLRERAAAGEHMPHLAAEYGITRASVTQIVTGQTRAAAGGPIREPRPRALLTDEQVERIRRLHGEGKTQVYLVRRFGLSQGYISDLLSQKRRAIRPGHGGN